MESGWFYILECCDYTYYSGSTIDIVKRLTAHKTGKGAKYTRDRLPVRLVYFEWFHSIYKAFDREKQVKGWSRKKKEALINYRYDLLPEYSKNYKQYPE